jgi:8-oxo-dGTP diphosphatase
MKDIQVRPLEEIIAKVEAEKLSGDAYVYEPAREHRQSVTVDVVIFTIFEDELQVLLIRRDRWPFKGCWALPGGFVRENEALGKAAERQLHEEAGVTDVYLQQLHAFGHPGRAPRTRVVTVAYYALIKPGQSTNNEGPKATYSEDAPVRWCSVYQMPDLAFDHDRIVELALAHLREKILTTQVSNQLMPEKFTLTQLQRTYEIVLGRELDKRNFRKKILASATLKETSERHIQGRHRPARLYSFDPSADRFLVS